MDRQKIFDKAILEVVEAEKLDEQNIYEESFAVFGRALEKLILLLKYTKDDNEKRKLLQVIEPIMCKAESLKCDIDIIRGYSVHRRCADGRIRHQSSQQSKLLKQILIKNEVELKDIFGLEKIKYHLLKTLQANVQERTEHLNGVLLYGPPGTGKTLLSRAFATFCQATYFKVDLLTFLKPNRNHRLIREIFELTHEYSPCFLVFESMEVFEKLPQPIKTNLLIQFETAKRYGICVIAITNQPWLLHHHIRRRFTKKFYFPLPSVEVRKQLFKKYFQESELKFEISDEVIEYISQNSIGFTGHNIITLSKLILMDLERSLKNSNFFKQNTKGNFVLSEPCSKCSVEEEYCINCKNITGNYQELESFSIQKKDISISLLDGVGHSEEEIEKYLSWRKDFDEDLI